jgi:EmrB/QacA subfamily drug resistance transporter
VPDTLEAFVPLRHVITGGRLGDLYGRRSMFILGLSGFTLTSALCGLAPTVPSLIVARVLQGFTAAVLFPQVFSLIHITFAQGEARARAFAALGVALGLAAVVGQVLGGILVAADLWDLSWRPIFLVNIPIGLTAIAAAQRLLPADKISGRQRLDVVGVVLSALGLGLLLYPLIEGQERGWPASSSAMLATALAILAVFAWHQHGKSLGKNSPLLQTDLFRNRAFTIGVLLVLLYYSTHSSFFLAYAFFVQIGLGLSPLSSGIILSAVPLAFMVGSAIAGRVATEWQPRVLTTGAAIKAAGNATAAATALLAVPTSGEALVPALLLVGLGQGLLVTPLFSTILGGIRHGDIGSASGMLSTMQQVGGAFGVALVGILFAAVLAHTRTAGFFETRTYAFAFAAASGYAALAGLVVLALLFALPPRDIVSPRQR